MLPPTQARRRKLSPKEETEEHFGGVIVPSPLSIIAHPTRFTHCEMSLNNRDNAHFKIFARKPRISVIACAESSYASTCKWLSGLPLIILDTLRFC